MTTSFKPEDLAKKRRPQLYKDKIMLAPMVRENSLPFRLLCLRHGADLVYTEELIDHKLSECRRLENKILGTIDYVDDIGQVVLRTCPEESDRLILQLGSNNPQRALKAARLASQDIVGLDFNFGCPKAFSLSGGMGAALLERPKQIEALLTECVCNLDIPVTCKIRLLPDRQETLKLVKMIESCGVSAIAVHGRTKDQRPRHENDDKILREISENLSNIPLIANGGSNHIRTYSDILKFKQSTGASSVMVARAAMKNPSIFQSSNVLAPSKTVITEFLELAIKYDNFVANSKYTIQSMLASGHYGSEFIQKVHAASDFKTLCELFSMADWYEKNRLISNKSDYYDPEQLKDPKLEQFIETKRAACESDGIKFVCENLPYIQRIYGEVSPKSQLIGYANKHIKRPTPPAKQQPNDTIEFKRRFEIEVFNLTGVTTHTNEKTMVETRAAIESNKNRYYCMITLDNVCYLNRAYTNRKKGAEQATAMLVCENLGLVDLADYKSRTSASNKNIA